jgi:4-alpha-glucanotransferase
MSFARATGILLHPTSLPSRGGIGDFGPAAYRFVDFLSSARQGIWQVLPLGPLGYGNSPYSSTSAFAGNPLLISLERLAGHGWIDRAQLEPLAPTSSTVEYDRIFHRKLPILFEAAHSFLRSASAEARGRFESFQTENAWWLEDFALFDALRARYKLETWNRWPHELATRQPAALEKARQELADDILVRSALQFAFYEQWRALCRYCAERAIRVVGDVAIFVNYDSADVWTHPDLFRLDANLESEMVSGVPPDFFSKTGQRWGNPLYRWDVLRQRNFDWWVDRIRRAHTMYDIIRLDHFRGFEAYWAIPAEEETAIHGQWVKCPGAQLFERLFEALGPIPIIAEDLGLITPEVEQLRQQFGMPGMRILQFGFGNRGAHNYLPHRYETNSVVYTGTHDNDTTAGWWATGANERERAAVRVYTGTTDNQPVVWPLIRAAAGSVADTCIFPLQDVLSLGSEARMNTPAATGDNWSWRFTRGAIQMGHAEQLAALTELTDRDALDPENTGA